MKRRATIVLSLGGSLIVPDAIAVSFLKRFRRLILAQAARGFRFIIVCGGGNTARRYQTGAHAVTPMSPRQLDWVGIAATKINAELVRVIFGSSAYPVVVDDPTVRIRSRQPIIIGSGWKPGCSSDKDAVLLARTYGAALVINMSNIPYVYTADPHRVPSAKPIRQMTWRALLGITGRRWHPGAHVPFDPQAALLAQREKMRVIVCEGRNLANLKNILLGKRYQGTTIS
ncbi:MAG: UMP kinase [Candidatus Kerfeldbacteria bacterium]|nr:UMP kinase [Candidatus Kerfeldbacteria bacterium]